MSDDVSEFRRLLPPPRRRPGLLAVGVRWRVELLLIGILAVLWYFAGVWAVVALFGGLLGVVTASAPARRVAVGLLQGVVVPHRVRSALVQAGVASRDGRLPWIVRAWPDGDAVKVSIWLRSGTTIGDLQAARPVIAAACAAERVDVISNPQRQDWAVLVVHRPRWGLRT